MGELPPGPLRWDFGWEPDLEEIALTEEKMDTFKME